MRIGVHPSYSQDFLTTVEDVVAYEKAGAAIAYVPEVYTFDAVSQLGYLAAKTDRLELGSGIVPFYTRTPTLLAMTGAGLDYVSGGRFTREIVDISRQMWRRERVVHHGKHYRIPLPPGEGTGLGKPLKLINHPVRPRIPMCGARHFRTAPPNGTPNCHRWTSRSSTWQERRTKPRPCRGNCSSGFR